MLTKGINYHIDKTRIDPEDDEWIDDGILSSLFKSFKRIIEVERCMQIISFNNQSVNTLRNIKRTGQVTRWKIQRG